MVRYLHDPQPGFAAAWCWRASGTCRQFRFQVSGVLGAWHYYAQWQTDRD